jgi:hypothetical protein
MPTYTQADLDLVKDKEQLIEKYKWGWLKIFIEAIFDFIGLSFMIEYIKSNRAEIWEHFIALLIAGSWAAAIYFMLDWLIEFFKSAPREAIEEVGEAAGKTFFKKIAKYFLWFMIVVDIVLVLWDVFSKFWDSATEEKEAFWSLYVKHFMAPNKDHIFEQNKIGIPEEPK